jgi:hypothetical protein
MLTVGVAIRLGRRPSEVERWPLHELALVAAYCQLEQEDFEKRMPSGPGSSAPPAAPPVRGGARVHTEQVRKVFVVKPSKKE